MSENEKINETMANEPEAAEEQSVVAVPDDYEPDESVYEKHTNLSSVVAAKDNITEEPKYERQKLKGRAAIENFWYHYKTPVLIALGVAVMLAIIIIESKPTKFDYLTLVYANVELGLDGPGEVADQLEEYGEDIDGNGEVKMNVEVYNRESEDVSTLMKAFAALQTDISDEYSSFLFITDKSNYDFIVECYGEDIFEKLDGFPEGIPLKDSELVTPITEKYGNDTELYIQLLRLPEDKADNSKFAARYDADRALIERILEENPNLGK